MLFRSSMRKFTEEELTQEQVVTLMKAALMAPTSKRSNAWQFIVVDEKDKLTKHKVSGMLLYAKTKDEMQPDGEYQMSGNKITVRTLDLYQSFAEIRKELDGIVAEHF